ncbi:hypothetical protein ACQKIE_01045 [Luteibacter sp. NPDC031894]|uniref:hypothetical protein n=1 Tax=Luteibacter sp. NPDC031894 TaxID=3390572 RepID=UPI003D08FF45
MNARHILEPIGTLAIGAMNASHIAQLARLVVTREGRTLVSMDLDRQVYATPAEHLFSKAMLRQYSDRCVGTYAPDSTAGDIAEDLVQQWKTDCGAAA